MSPRLLHYSDVENAYDDPDRLARLAGALNALDGPDSLLVGTGDNTGPGVLSLVTDGQQSVELFGAVDPAFETFGNHDFDHGVDATRAIVGKTPQTWLTANVREDGNRFAADETEPWALRTVDGTRVGFVGVTTPDAEATSPGAAPSRSPTRCRPSQTPPGRCVRVAPSGSSSSRISVGATTTSPASATWT
nr:metallophosphoesterase [Halomicroarcula sp. YJ-61-S]